MAEKYALRLRTKNYRRVTSHAIAAIDYNPKAKIIEIEFIDGEVYHYHDATRKEWNEMVALAKKGEGIGAYINQTFKEPYKKQERNFFKINILAEH